jgi:hypothetical protein
MDNIDKPVLGRDIPWKQVKGEALRVTHFLPVGTIENGKIKIDSLTSPYATLSVESPKLKQESEIMVVNRIDFSNLWKAYKERGIDPKEEVLVFCVPVFRHKLFKMFYAPMARLQIYIYPKGHFEEICDKNFKRDNTEEWLEPLAKYIPPDYSV